MPFTPFHFGPGAALHALAPRQVSFWAFCGANVLIDVEPLYFMVRGEPPLHRFFHTYIGATLVALATIVLFYGAMKMATHLKLPNLFNWQVLTLRSVSLGAVLGTYTHVLLDSIMHHDIAPLNPLSSGNALLGIIPLGVLHWLCIAAGIFAVILIFCRKLRQGDSR